MAILLIDIGNTHIHLGIEDKGLKILPSLITHKTFSLSKKIISKIHCCIICSVVPQKTKEIKKYLSQLHINTYILGKDITVPIKINYRGKPLGQDRILLCYGALQYFKPPLIVIDLGTALTVDFVSSKGIYQGGIIFPGITLSLEALVKNAALLRHIDVSCVCKPKNLIGKNTYEAIGSGIWWGYKILCKGIVETLKKKHPSLKVILTGGGVKYFRRKWSFIDLFSPHLNLIALEKIAKFYNICQK